MDETGRCAVCGVGLTPQEFYVVRIDVFADPSPPPDPADGSDSGDGADQIADLIDQMSQMTADELQDGVHRRFEYRVCGRCQRMLLANPLGLPRRSRAATAN